MVGSSPRGRGTRAAELREEAQARVIPAWAGNTVPTASLICRISGHPRVGGEHPIVYNAPEVHYGSSPRGRGTQAQPVDGPPLVRVIPAWAGNTCAGANGCSRSSGHPRVGGEHLWRRSTTGVGSGSSPRGRGTRRPPFSRWWAARVIPAWAGNTGLRVGVIGLETGHPRVGGEHGPQRPTDDPHLGSSPRGRGTRCSILPVPTIHRVIPAWAGNTRATVRPVMIEPGHPRVGGEHISSVMSSLFMPGSSPRGRGTHVAKLAELRPRRVIPAWAGNTPIASN